MWRLRTFLPQQQQEQQEQQQRHQKRIQQPQNTNSRRPGEGVVSSRFQNPPSVARLPSPVKPVRRRPSTASKVRRDAPSSASRTRSSPRNEDFWHRRPDTARPQAAEKHVPPQHDHRTISRTAGFASEHHLTSKPTGSVRSGLSNLGIRTRPNTAAARVVTQHGVAEQNKQVREQQQQQQRRRRRRQGTTAAQRHAHLAISSVQRRQRAHQRKLRKQKEQLRRAAAMGTTTSPRTNLSGSTTPHSINYGDEDDDSSAVWSDEEANSNIFEREPSLWTRQAFRSRNRRRVHGAFGVENFSENSAQASDVSHDEEGDGASQLPASDVLEAATAAQADELAVLDDVADNISDRIDFLEESERKIDEQLNKARAKVRSKTAAIEAARKAVHEHNMKLVQKYKWMGKYAPSMSKQIQQIENKRLEKQAKEQAAKDAAESGGQAELFQPPGFS